MVSISNRVSRDEAIKLLVETDALELASMADSVRLAKHPEGVVTFIIDRNINYTNICSCKCKFCAYYRGIDDSDSFVMSHEELGIKIQETIDANGTQILIQGGLHPDLKIDWYVNMLKFIKSNYDIWVHGFSSPEIAHIAKVSDLTIAETIRILKEAGLDSIPGGGAEVLVDAVREAVSPNKINSKQWLDVMEEAHKQGMKTTATMMFRSDEKAENIIDHLLAIRDLQDKTGGFTAFIPWPFQPGNTELGGVAATAMEYLRVLAVSRIVLDNISNIQVSWVTQGEKVGQMGLLFGANDFGSVMMEENVVKAAGASFRMHTDEIVYQIKKAGFTPKIRNMMYEVVSDA